MIILPITPKPTPRPRVGKFGTHYPKHYEQYKKDIKKLVNLYCKNHFKGVIRLEAYFFMSIPVSLSKIKREALNDTYCSKLNGDIDNLTKGLLDALNGVAFDDDSQVCELLVRKVYSYEPRIEFELVEI